MIIHNPDSNYPSLENCLFGAVKLTRNTDIDKYKNFGYGIGFDRKIFFSHPSEANGRNVIIFGVDMSPSSYTDEKRKTCNFILGKGPTQRLCVHSLTAEKIY